MAVKKEQHWEKEFVIDGVKLRVRKLNPFEFPAFQTSFAKAIDANDSEGIAKSYKTMSTWLEAEMPGGLWMPAYDKTTERFTVENLNDMATSAKLINYMIAEIITPLFQNTAE